MLFLSKEVPVNHVKLHTEHFGKDTNPACVLISGAMANGRFWSDEFCQKLAYDYFVIRYDNRDTGESSTVDWKQHPYFIEDLAKDALGILDAYNIKKAHFIGHSMGGHIAQQLALNHHERVNSISVISSGPIGGTAETDRPLTGMEQATLNKTWDIMLARKDGHTMDETIDGFLRVWGYLNGVFPLDQDMAKKYTRDLLTRAAHKPHVGNNHELLMRHLGNELPRRRYLLERIHIPTLVIHGERDPLALQRDGRAIAHAIARAQLLLIPGMGHMFFHRELESIIAELVLEHLKNQS